jgi:hypothetical protein
LLYGTDGQAIGPRQVENVSVGGAMLSRENDDELPAHFVLSLSRNGQVRRHCRVAWRAKHRVGVRFIEHVEDEGRYASFNEQFVTGKVRSMT